MSPWWIVALLASPQPRVVDLTERPVAWVAVGRGADFEVVSSASALLEKAAAPIEARTRLDPRRLDDAEVDRCLDRIPLAGYVTCRVLAAHRLGIPVLFQLSGIRRGDSDLLRIEWLRVAEVAEDVLRTVEAIDPAGPTTTVQGAYDAVTDRVIAALRVGRERTVDGPEDIAAAIEASFDDELAALAEDPDLGRRSGALELDVRPAEALVALDRRALGAAGSAGLRVLGVTAGEHLLLVEHPGLRPEDRTFTMPARGDLRLEVELVEDHAAAWWVATVTGVGLALGGVGVAVWGATEDRPRPAQADLGLIRLIGSDRQPSVGATAVGEGPLVVGLAAGLGVAGGLLTVLGLTGRDSPRSPWVEVLVSLGAGLAAYGVTEAVNAASY